jgi:RNA polymerase sigma-70 factor (ECF subfamily)
MAAGKDQPQQVLAVIYLVFNEGYLASAGRTPARRDLAVQAVALNRRLHQLMPREPEVLGLLALLLLHESRAATRFDGWGQLVRLQDQDGASCSPGACRCEAGWPHIAMTGLTSIVIHPAPMPGQVPAISTASSMLAASSSE